MGLIYGLVKRLIKISIYFLIFAALVVLIPNLPPYTKFTTIHIEPSLPRTGSLAPNDALNNAGKVYVDKLLGPEAFQIYKGDLYTSLATGEIVKISPGGHVTFVTQIGQPCSGLTYEHICGRPLGFEIDENKNVIYVSDAYHGIWKVDLKNDKKQLLVSPRVAIEGREPKLFNSIALAKNGDFYWTDSTSDFQLKDGAISALVDPSGRLLHYNSAKNQSKVLLDDLWFSNGIIISPNKQFLVVSETSRMQLLKYYIDGPKKGKSEVFVTGLPGVPDNLRALPDGSGVLVALYTAFDDDNPLLLRSLAAAPLARKLLARLQRLAEIPFEYLNTVYPHVLLEEIVYKIGHFQSMSGVVPKMSGLVQLDWEGNIVASYFNNDGSINHISDAIVFNGKLHLGNPHVQNFIGTVAVPPLLKKAFESKSTKPEVPKVETKKETPKPAQAKPVETPKPTPKPAEQPKPTQKPVEQPKPTQKPVEQPKPTQKPVEQPKPTQKPVEQPKPTPKPLEQPKPVEQPKPTPKPVEQPKPTPKPAEQAKPTPKTVEQPKPTSKPVEQPKPAQPKPITPQKTEPKVQAKQEPKPEVKTPTPKAAPSQAKPTPAKPETKSEVKPQATNPKESQKPTKEQPKPSAKPEQIPIKEEIPSDTAKPTKETLKVIKKGGPTEIPNPNI